MRPEDVAEHLRKRPFEPIRIFMSDGASYDVRHPDMCMVAPSTVYVGLPNPRVPGTVVRVAHCALSQITRIEPHNGTRTGGRGRGRRA